MVIRNLPKMKRVKKQRKLKTELKNSSFVGYNILHKIKLNRVSTIVEQSP